MVHLSEPIWYTYFGCSFSLTVGGTHYDTEVVGSKPSGQAFFLLSFFDKDLALLIGKLDLLFKLSS